MLKSLIMWLTFVLHKFYYEPEYMKGGNGSETCVKQEASLKVKTEKGQ